ncbi:hypothetical protein [Streptomyces sp. VN1]|uniref:hypothetical protein n=1 Tax=Streptomyces sp. VN1 TaxID=1821625 RepID=UPI001413A1A5|nr:hypothetical protein [Streptomyces sp. VN1]QIP74752.1 hypothetical protein EZV63_36995 [Streptomyces sp. VN1]
MTAPRRILGSGPQDAHTIRAAQADLLGTLPVLDLPDVDELRARGVLGGPTTMLRAPRRPLGAGGRADEDPHRVST